MASTEALTRYAIAGRDGISATKYGEDNIMRLTVVIVHNVVQVVDRQAAVRPNVAGHATSDVVTFCRGFFSAFPW